MLVAAADAFVFDPALLGGARAEAQDRHAAQHLVAAAGTVHVDPYRVIERYSHVMHIVSGVKGRVAPGRDAFDLFAATFPAGTLVGAPKVRAMEIIDELEPVRRGLYGGTVGYFGARGDMDQAITIRTLVFRGDEYSYQAGAGIVADSSPAAEHDGHDGQDGVEGEGTVSEWLPGIRDEHDDDPGWQARWLDRPTWDRTVTPNIRRRTGQRPSRRRR